MRSREYTHLMRLIAVGNSIATGFTGFRHCRPARMRGAADRVKLLSYRAGVGSNHVSDRFVA